MPAASSDILASLPHRPPFRFLSEITRLEPGASGEALWRVQGDEPFFAGHFPDQPIVPGVLIGEALAQLSGLVVLHQTDSAHAGRSPQPAEGRLAHLDVRFQHAVVPPASIVLQTQLTRSMGDLFLFDVRAEVEDKIAARGSLTLARVDRAAPTSNRSAPQSKDRP